MSTNRITVLVVDDDPSLRMLVERIIKRHFETSVVMGISAGDGFRKFQESRPDLVITDLEMEDQFAGFRLAEAIKVLAPSTRVILMSGNLPSKIDEVGYIDRVLQKPFGAQDMVSAIEELGFERRR